MGRELTALPEFPDAELVMSAAEVEAGLERLAAKLQPLIDHNDCLLLGVMNGGLFPLVRIADRLSGDFLIDYCHASRYRGKTEGRGLYWEREPGELLSGRTVVVIDDIYDQGLTLEAVAERCKAAGATEVVTAVMFVKDCSRQNNLARPNLDAGLVVPDRYVFGCGMDYHNRWRHLPDIYALREALS